MCTLKRSLHMHMWAESCRVHHRACSMPMITIGTLVSVKGFGTAARECTSKPLTLLVLLQCTNLKCTINEAEILTVHT